MDLRNQFDIFENAAKALSDADTYAFEYSWLLEIYSNELEINL